MHARRALLVILVLAAVVAACSGGASPSPSGSAAPSRTPVDTPEEAAAAVIASDPRFEGLGPLDPELIGQCCFYEVTEVEGGYQVLVEVGWGDCPAGCINRHRWTFGVNPDGVVALLGETGPPIPAGEFPPPDGAGAGGY